MSDPTNGKPTKAGILVFWDAATQSVGLQVDHEQVKTMEFAVALLDIAKAKIEEMRKMVLAQQMQAAANQTARDEALHRKILEGR